MRISGRTRGAAILVVLLLLLGLAGAWLLDGPEPADRPAIDPSDPQQVSLGGSIYAEHCASCHGTNLEGQANWRTRRPDGRLPAPPHNETGHTWHHPDSQLFAMVKRGLTPFAPDGYQTDMPAYDETLSDAEIAAVLSYIQSRWPAEIRKRQAEITERSRVSVNQ